jgi:hypothetical protein
MAHTFDLSTPSGIIAALEYLLEKDDPGSKDSDAKETIIDPKDDGKDNKK